MFLISSLSDSAIIFTFRPELESSAVNRIVPLFSKVKRANTNPARTFRMPFTLGDMPFTHRLVVSFSQIQNDVMLTNRTLPVQNVQWNCTTVLNDCLVVFWKTVRWRLK